MTPELRRLLESARETIMHGRHSTGYCMCGSKVEGHSWGDGHSPVDEGEYFAWGVIERIDEALGA